MSDFDLIVSNPPYIEENDPHLKQGDLVFEPKSALVSNDNGLADIKLISNQAKNFLKSGGSLMFEHGFKQGASVRDILIKENYIEIRTIQDLEGLDRVTIASLI